jgi:hypothetical protein
VIVDFRKPPAGAGVVFRNRRCQADEDARRAFDELVRQGWRLA